jgi:hypothetical protein
VRTLDLMRWADGVDAPRVVRGASAGFTVLVLGGLSAPLAANFVPVVGVAWLPLTSIVAFVVAASRIGTATRPWAHGAVAALSAYLLILPLVLMSPAGRVPAQIALTAAAAVVVGALTGLLRGIRRDRRE